MVPLVP